MHLSVSRIEGTCDHLIECSSLTLETDQSGEDAVEGGQQERQQEDDRQGPPREARMSSVVGCGFALQRHAVAWVTTSTH